MQSSRTLQFEQASLRLLELMFILGGFSAFIRAFSLGKAFYAVYWLKFKRIKWQ
jgi:hypothetical protein